MAEFVRQRPRGHLRRIIAGQRIVIRRDHVAIELDVMTILVCEGEDLPNYAALGRFGRDTNPFQSGLVGS